MKTHCLLIALLMAFGARAQTVTDRIYLNDSITVYEGLMVEQAPAKYIKIYRFKQKDTIQVMLKEVWKMVKVYPPPDTPKKQLAPPPVKKENERKARTAFAELFGAAVFYSANFEQRLHKKGGDGWGLRAGLGIMPASALADSGSLRAWLLAIPLGATYLWGEKNHFLECGAGITYFLRLSGSTENNNNANNRYDAYFLGLQRKASQVTGNFTFGYRFIARNNGLMAGLAFMPVIGNDFFLTNFGLKIGYQF